MSGVDIQKPAVSPTSPTMRKRQRTTDHPGAPTTTDGIPLPPVGPVTDDAFITDHDANDSGAEDEDDEDKPKDKKAGRRKIKIEFIQDKSRRHITFSKRKAGIMKKAYELSTLTGTQVLLLVVSETGLVYTFTTAKLQPLVTQPEGKNLIQACLNAPHGALPSSMPVGPPIGRSSNPMVPPGPPPSANIPGGLSIGAGAPANVKEDDDDDHHDDTNAHGGRPNTGEKRRRHAPSTSGGAPPVNRGPTSPATANANVPTLNIPSAPGGQAPHSAHPQQSGQSMNLSPTSPQQHHPQVPAPGQYSPTYTHHPGPQHQQQQQQHDQIYNSHLMGSGSYSYPPAAPPAQGGPGQQLGGLAAAAATQQPQQQHGHWPAQQQQPQVTQTGAHYNRR
ncbi:SRF-TF-domain-containing protein [Agrocybe pediades]|nr:SRF-TF-domain-containing protein [Agrocybe pediades]